MKVANWLTRPRARLALVVLGVAPCASRADRGAVSLEGGVGMTALNQPAPYASPSASTLGGAATIVLGGRYALTNNWEISLWGFYEPQVAYFHNGINITTSNGAFPGTLSEQVTRFGGLAGIRHVWGSVFRFAVGLDVGWSHRSYAKLDAINDTDSSYPVDYGLSLANSSTDNFVLSPMFGIEWALGDHYSLSLMPRFELLLGKDATWAVTAPLCFSWQWFI
jgi:hypothetical protein